MQSPLWLSPNLIRGKITLTVIVCITSVPKPCLLIQKPQAFAELPSSTPISDNFFVKLHSQ